LSATAETDARAALRRSAEAETAARAACRRIERDVKARIRRLNRALARERRLAASLESQYAACLLGDATTVDALETLRAGRLRVIDLTKRLGRCRVGAARLRAEISALQERLEEANVRLKRAVSAAGRLRRAGAVVEVNAGVAAPAGG
jgi:hypothetical protein